MALSRDDAQATQRFNFFMVDLPLGAQPDNFSLLGACVQRLIGFHSLDQFLDIAAQHDVGTATGHVGGNGDHAGASGLCHDVCLTRVLLGVEHLVRQFFFFQQLVNDLGVFNRGGTHQHGLTALVAITNVFDRRLVFFTGCLVDTVQLVFALAAAVRRDHCGLESVDFLELIGLSVGRTGHASQFAVQTEVVLKGN